MDFYHKIGCLALVLSVVYKLVDCKLYCKLNSDCDSLGSLQCIKSQCDWGVCGCERGFVARYLGSENGFQCVKLKKYDESCSTYDDSGICGAPNSECVDGKCRCKNNFKPMWGGEFCGDPESLMPTETALSGDTCPRGLGVTRSGAASYLPFQIMDHAPPSCACSPGTHTGLPNSFDDTSGYFLGKKRPMCVSAKIGSICLTNNDCPSGAMCGKGNKCVCKIAGHVPSYDKTTCGLPLNIGDLCGGSNRICDGNKGLVCGDVCDLSGNSSAARCTCGPSHTKTKTTCQPKTVGSSCHGDLNCKHFSENGICVDGVCKDSAGHLLPNLLTLLVTLAVAMQRL